MKKRILSLFLAASFAASMFTVSFLVKADATGTVPTKADSYGEGIPGEYGTLTGSFTLGGKNYFNYQGGCVETNSDNTVVRSWGGANFDQNGVPGPNVNNAAKYICDSFVASRSVTDSANTDIAAINDASVTGDSLKQLYVNEYMALANAGYIVGVPISPIDNWDGVIKVDFRFGGSTGSPFETARAYLTTIVASSDGKAVYPIKNEFVNYYVPGLVGSPKGAQQDVTVDGIQYTIQQFSKGYMVSDPNDKKVPNAFNGKSDANGSLKYNFAYSVVNGSYDATSGKFIAVSSSSILSSLNISDDKWADIGTDASIVGDNANRTNVQNQFKDAYTRAVNAGISMGNLDGENIHNWGGVGLSAGFKSGAGGPGDLMTSNNPGDYSAVIYYNPTKAAAYYSFGAVYRTIRTPDAVDSTHDTNWITQTAAYPTQDVQVLADGTMYQNFKGGYVLVQPGHLVGTFVAGKTYTPASTSSSQPSSSSQVTSSTPSNTSSTVSDVTSSDDTSTDTGVSEDSSTTSDSTSSETANVNTGDNGAALPIAILLLAACGATAVAMTRKKK